MKKVMMIAYYWPPDNAAGTHRPLRFARHLPQFDWEPVILTADPIYYMRYDPRLLNRVPQGIQVVRASHRDLWLSFQNWRRKRLAAHTPTTPLKNEIESQVPLMRSSVYRLHARKAVRWLESRLYHPDYCMNWIASAIQAAEQACPNGCGVDAIWATGNPWSDFVVGYHLSRRWHLPLILDFRDGWTITSSDFETDRPRWAQARDRHDLEQYLRAADAVVFLTHTYAERYLKTYAPTLRPEKVHVIPNGFEQEPFKPMPPKGQKLSILYVGLLAQRRYDTLFQALANLLSRGEARNIDVSFVGDSEPDARRLVERLGLSDQVHFYPPLPYDKVQLLMERSHTLLVLGEKPMPGMDLFVTSKLFHYWSVGRPVLGVLPANGTRMTMEEVGARLVADVDSFSQIEQVLLDLYRAWEAQSLDNYVLPPSRLKPYIEPYPSRLLANVLDGLRQPAPDLCRK